MNRRHFTSMPTLALVLVLLPLVVSVGAVAAQSGQALWFASYWDNPDQEGDPIFRTSEGVIDHDWGKGSPQNAIDADTWSARWTSYVDFTPGTYRFTVTSDDGVRLYVGDKHIVVDWSKHPERTHVATVSLSGGRYPVAVDYFEDVGEAMLKVQWERTGAPAPDGGYVTVLSSGPVIPPPGPAGNWLASYWNNARLEGNPVLWRTEAAINYDWGSRAPAEGVNSDNWSARWETTVYFAPGSYKFTATTDDGIRAWVDGVLIVDAWHDTATRTVAARRNLSEGNHHIRVEYYDRGGFALARFSWQIEDPAITAWRGEYFNNATLSGTPVLVRDDAAIDFNWGTSAPARSITSNHFSARWTRSMDLSPGRYRFFATCDDGARLWVDNRLVIDHWYDHAAETHYADVDWLGGRLPVRMEYYEHEGLAESRLSWWRLGAAADTGGQPAAMVNTAWLNVRNGPGADYSRLTALPHGTYVSLMARNAEATWAWVSLPDGRQGWMYVPYLKSAYPIASLPLYDTGVPENGAGSIPTAVVARAQYLNLRSGPGVEHTILDQLRYGDVVTLVGYRNQAATWVKVIAPNGRQGWVNAYYLASDFPFLSLQVGG